MSKNPLLFASGCYLFCHCNTPNKTMIRFHQEKLSSAREREQMRQYWQKVLEKLTHLSSFRT